MDWFWTWGGVSVGYRNGTSLVLYSGREIGRFFGDEIYGADGRYLGEIRDGKRLVCVRSKRSIFRTPFRPVELKSLTNRPHIGGLPTPAGCEEFPVPRTAPTAARRKDGRDAA